MVFDEETIEQAVQMAGTTIENVCNIEYLGSRITWDNNCLEEIKRRIDKAIGAMTSLKHIWDGKKLTIQNKLRILTACVFSVLLRYMPPKHGPLKQPIKESYSHST